MIAVEGLIKRYGSQAALQSLDLTVPRGEIFGFVGPNGAGKTTTIRILATLSLADEGTASIAGVPVAQEPAAVRELVGYMPDFFGVYDRLTAEEYLEFYAACHGVPRRRRQRVARELLALIDLGDRARAQVDTLSRGMKQRLGLARALVHDPQVLLLDEPASGLDPRARVELRELLKELRRMGKTILISSHILPELEEYCTWVGFVDQGRMVAEGPIGEVRSLACRLRIELGEPTDEALAGAAATLGRTAGVTGAAVVDQHLEVDLSAERPEHELLRELVESGVSVRYFAPLGGGLSDAFMRLTAPEPEGSESIAGEPEPAVPRTAPPEAETTAPPEAAT